MSSHPTYTHYKMRQVEGRHEPGRLWGPKDKHLIQQVAREETKIWRRRSFQLQGPTVSFLSSELNSLYHLNYTLSPVNG